MFQSRVEYSISKQVAIPYIRIAMELPIFKYSIAMPSIGKIFKSTHVILVSHFSTFIISIVSLSFLLILC